MSTRAYILIETSIGKTGETLEKLRGISGINQADAVTGPYDIIAVVEAADLNSVGDLVTSRVHSVAGIVRTITCLTASVQ